MNKTIDIGILMKKLKSQMYTEAILKWENSGRNNTEELIEDINKIYCA